MSDKIKTIIEYKTKSEEERKANCAKALNQYINNKLKNEQKVVDNAQQKVV